MLAKINADAGASTNVWNVEILLKKIISESHKVKSPSNIEKDKLSIRTALSGFHS